MLDLGSRTANCRRSLFLVLLFVACPCACNTTTSAVNSTVFPEGHGHVPPPSQKRLVPDEQRLLEKIFKHYEPSVRPVYDATNSVMVEFGVTLIQIMDMVSAT